MDITLINSWDIYNDISNSLEALKNFTHLKSILFSEIFEDKELPFSRLFKKYKIFKEQWIKTNEKLINFKLNLKCFIEALIKHHKNDMREFLLNLELKIKDEEMLKFKSESTQKLCIFEKISIYMSVLDS